MYIFALVHFVNVKNHSSNLSNLSVWSLCVSKQLCFILKFSYKVLIRIQYLLLHIVLFLHRLSLWTQSRCYYQICLTSIQMWYICMFLSAQLLSFMEHLQGVPQTVINRLPEDRRLQSLLVFICFVTLTHYTCTLSE